MMKPRVDTDLFKKLFTANSILKILQLPYKTVSAVFLHFDKLCLGG